MRADVTIGPRQIVGFFGSIRKPIDITSIPYAFNGFILFPSLLVGCSFSIPKIRGIDGPYISASRIPTVAPS